MPESFTLLVKSFPNASFERFSPDALPNIDPNALAALHTQQPNTVSICRQSNRGDAVRRS